MRSITERCVIIAIRARALPQRGQVSFDVTSVRNVLGENMRRVYVAVTGTSAAAARATRTAMTVDCC